MLFLQLLKFNTSYKGLVFIFILPLFVNSQTVSDTINSYEEDSLVSSNYFILNTSYTNNSLTDKTLNGIQMAALFADVSFFHKSGFYTSLLPTYYLNTTIPTYDLDYALGFQKSYDFGINYTMEYSYHTFYGDSIFQGINYNHGVNFSIGYSIQNFEIFADGYGLFGTTNNFISSQGISYSLDFEHLFTNNDYLSFYPTIMTVFSTDYWIYENLRPMHEYWFKRYLQNLGYKTNSFDYQSVDFVLPISYSINDLTLSFSYFYTIPSNKYKEFDWENQSSIMTSISYILNFK